MNNAMKTNLKKLTFLGFGRSLENNGNNRDGEARLDDECAKVFAMDVDPGFDFHEEPFTGQPKFNEKDYKQHRQQGYHNVHVPLKKGSKFMRRRQGSQQNTPTNTPQTSSPPTLTPQESSTTSPSLEQSLPSITPLYNSTFSKQGSVTEPLTSPSTLHEESESANNESDSESECVLSDPCPYRTTREGEEDLEDSLPEERRVQFLNCENLDQFDVDGLKAKKKKRHHHGHHSKFRKFSLPEVGAGKKRHHHHHHHHERDSENRNLTVRRVSTQPEDEELGGADKDMLDSHRSDDPRALRRHKTTRPSITHIGKGFDLHPSLKKLYDHSPHAIFVELSELYTTEEENEREWKETARWIKYEEDVEEGVDRWGKPHVASLSFHSLLNLRKCLENGVIILDLEEKDLPAIAYRISEDLFREDLIKDEDKAKIMRVLLLRHRHVNEHHDRGFRFTSRKLSSFTSLQSLYDAEKRKCSYQETPLKNGDAEHKLLSPNDHQTVVDIKDDNFAVSNEDIRGVRNDAILKRIPAKAEGACILAGEVDFLEQPAIAFVRLSEGVMIPSLMEVTLPVRFIFLLLGPKLPNIDYHEVGRSISTLMSNQQFHNIAYKADSRKELLSAINDFLDDSIVLPPGDWERQALLPIEEIKAKSDAIKRRKANALKKEQEAQGIIKPLLASGDEDGEKKPPYPDPLERTRRPFGGLFNDVKRRYPHYKTDILDGLNSQCAAGAIFMYFAAVSGAIAFGGLLGDKTKSQIGISETLLSTSIGGIIFALLSGQPLLIVGTTGGLLLFDESLIQFCQANGYEFLTIRVFIGIWLGVIGLVVACFEGSVFVKLFSRFTEDIFSALIVLLYIMETIVKIIMYYYKHPLLSNYCDFQMITYKNSSEIYNYTSNSGDTGFNFTENGMNELVPVTTTERLPDRDFNGPINQPNTALFCTVLTLGCFSIAYYLKMFRNSQFLGRSARRALGDFGVPIAIVFMVFVDYMTPQIFTEKLSVPEGFSPSDPEYRGWFIPPSGIENPLPVWVMFASVVPAMLVYILLFMETHISELIINKKERKLKKGAGYHLDIVLICLINIVCGFCGFPWMCCAAVRSIAHTSALTVMSRTHAPGEKPHIIEVKEQRLSALLVAIFIGLSVFMAPLLRLVPMAVLLGIFLYMGVASIDGIQFFDRIKLLFMPVKHHPQASYVRRVRTAKMHLYTFIQLMCLVILWIVKSTKASLGFPFFLILMVPLREQMKHVFSKRELIALDGEQPDLGDEDEPDFYAEAPLPG